MPDDPRFTRLTQAQVEPVELALRNAALEAGLDWQQALYVLGLFARALADTAPNAHGISIVQAELLARRAFEQGFHTAVITVNTTRQ